MDSKRNFGVLDRGSPACMPLREVSIHGCRVVGLSLAGTLDASCLSPDQVELVLLFPLGSISRRLLCISSSTYSFVFYFFFFIFFFVLLKDRRIPVYVHTTENPGIGLEGPRSPPLEKASRSHSAAPVPSSTPARALAPAHRPQKHQLLAALQKFQQRPSCSFQTRSRSTRTEHGVELSHSMCSSRFTICPTCT
jgi:hypothetical protein